MDCILQIKSLNKPIDSVWYILIYHKKYSNGNISNIDHQNIDTNKIEALFYIKILNKFELILEYSGHFKIEGFSI